jgi:ABC-type sugar transport system substrate-binding protein
MKRLVAVVLVGALALALGCPAGAEKRFRVGFMPKLEGIPYFNACKEGAEEAARELGIKLDYAGPTRADANQQNDMLRQWVHSGSYDCIAVACNDPDLVAGALREARQNNILVITYDADTQPDARQFFVNMATYDAVAEEMVKAMGEELEPKRTGKVGILTSSIQAPNQSEWARRIKAYVKDNPEYHNLVLLPEEEHGEDRDAGIRKAKAMIQANPDLKGIIGLTSVAVPAAAEAVRQEGKKGQIKVTGVSTPKDMRDYVKDGTVNVFVLWNPVDLGYLTVHVADLLHKGKMPEKADSILAGRLGTITVSDKHEVLLGKPIRFTRDNIDDFHF